MSTTTAVVGLGDIGGPIAARIVECGHDVVGVDGDRGRREAWGRTTGAPIAASIGELDSVALERVLVLVRTTDQAVDVLETVSRFAARRDTEPVAAHLMTTLDPGAARRLGDRTDALLRLLEQPVSGGATGATAGTLTVLSAGPIRATDTDFLTRTIAGRVVGFTEYGLPTLAKLVNNAIAALNTRSTARMVVLAAALGLDARQLKDVVDVSSGASAMGAMLEQLADEQAELLTKDVALLATVTDGLPVIDLHDPDGFLDDLRAARDLLGRGVPREAP